jgi:3-oxoadipate enol-lactonase
MPFAKTPSANLHYTVRGSGSNTLLFIQGLGAHASEWGEPFLQPLSERYRVVCMDNRGIGESQTDVLGFSLLDMAEDACAVLDAVGAQRAYLAGTSMGGMISQLLAAEHPERVERLALMSTTFGGREALPPTPEAGNALLPAPGVSPRDLHERTLRALTAPGFADAHPQLIAELANLRGRVPTRGRIFKAQFAALASSDRSKIVQTLQMPTLVLHGDEDALIPIENGRQLAARIPGAEFALLTGCGHFPHFEQPQQNADVLLAFLG